MIVRPRHSGDCVLARIEFSFSGDFLRAVKAATFSFTVLVVIAFLFRQGFSIRNGAIIKKVSACRWQTEGCGVKDLTMR